jgi:5-keto 4-deoxyuronate isomerase
MKVKFTLTMDDLTVDDLHYDEVVIDWISEVEQEEVLDLSQKWITSQNFLTRRMIGLQRVGESSLTIEPLDESSIRDESAMSD